MKIICDKSCNILFDEPKEEKIALIAKRLFFLVYHTHIHCDSDILIRNETGFSGENTYTIELRHHNTRHRFFIKKHRDKQSSLSESIYASKLAKINPRIFCSTINDNFFMRESVVVYVHASEQKGGGYTCFDNTLTEFFSTNNSLIINSLPLAVKNLILDEIKAFNELICSTKTLTLQEYLHIKREKLPPHSIIDISSKYKLDIRDGILYVNYEETLYYSSVEIIPNKCYLTGDKCYIYGLCEVNVVSLIFNRKDYESVVQYVINRHNRLLLRYPSNINICQKFNKYIQGRHPSCTNYFEKEYILEKLGSYELQMAIRHNDLHLRNIIVFPDLSFKIIDLSDISINSIYYDAVRLEIAVVIQALKEYDINIVKVYDSIMRGHCNNADISIANRLLCIILSIRNGVKLALNRIFHNKEYNIILYIELCTQGYSLKNYQIITNQIILLQKYLLNSII